MPRRLILITILAATLAMFGALAAGCGDGGGDTLTLEEYFERFEVIDADVDREIEALFADFPDDSEVDFFSNEENLDLVKELFAGFPRVLGNALDELRDLNPPSEVENEHDVFLEAGDELLAEFQSAASTVEDAETMEEVDAINTSVEAEIGLATERFDAACLSLVDVGVANGITVDVTCEDEA